MKDDCILLPVYDPADTDETFAAKLAQMQKTRLEEQARPLPEQMTFVRLSVPSKIVEAFQKSGRMNELEDAAEIVAGLFKQVLVKLYYAGKEERCTENKY